jgi:hypothetical protein
MVHPREPPVTASSATVASRLKATHVCTVSTLREYGLMRNGKLMLACAETVEDETSLWKEKEKEVENLHAADFTELWEQLQREYCVVLL